jgi:HAD superfamily hydrolase (TIGR01549 family)
MTIEAVLFDLDGVLVHSPLDFKAIKRELFGDSKTFIIEGLEALPPGEREIKDALLLARELEAAEKAELDQAVPDLFEWLQSRSIKRGVITRNSNRVVKAIAERLSVDFGVVVGREDAPPKPNPECIHAACRKLMVRAGSTVMVGDYLFDIQAGRSAGCRTVFLETDEFRHLEPGADVRIGSLGELRPVLERWLDGVA